MKRAKRRRIMFGLARWLAQVALWAAAREGVPGAASALELLGGAK